MKAETHKEKHQRWVNAMNIAWEKGWYPEHGWIFRSPSGTLHDLSAADLTQLDRIEKEGLFLVGGKKEEKKRPSFAFKDELYEKFVEWLGGRNRFMTDRQDAIARILLSMPIAFGKSWLIEQLHEFDKAHDGRKSGRKMDWTGVSVDNPSRHIGWFEVPLEYNYNGMVENIRCAANGSILQRIISPTRNPGYIEILMQSDIFDATWGDAPWYDIHFSYLTNLRVMATRRFDR